MSNVNIDLELNIKAFNKAIEDALKRVENFSDKGKKGFGGLNIAWGSFVGNLASNAVTSMASSLSGMVKGSFDAAVSLESMSTELGVMLGSAAAGEAQLKSLQEFAASTPFQLPGIVDASKKLLAFGTTAEQLPDVLTTIGNVAAGSGKDISELATIFGQVKGETKLTLERFNQLNDAGISLRSTLANQLGVSLTEVKDQITKGKVSFEQFSTAMNTISSDGGTFADAMIKKSTTLGGVLSTLSDNVFNLQGTLGQQLLPILKGAALAMIEMVQASSDALMPFFTWFKENGETFGKSLMISIPLIAAGLIAMNAAFVAQQIAATAAWVATLGPIALIVAGMVAVGAAVYAVVKYWDDIKNGAKLALAAALDFAGQFSAAAKAQAAELRKEVAADKEAKIKAEQEKADAVAAIQAGELERSRAKQAEEKLIQEQAKADAIQLEQDKLAALRAITDAHQEALALADEEFRLASQEAELNEYDATIQEKENRRIEEIKARTKHNLDKIKTEQDFQLAQAKLITDSEARRLKIQDINNKAELSREETYNKETLDKQTVLNVNRQKLNDKRFVDEQAMGNNLMNLGRNNSKQLFEMGKKLSLAQATVAGYTAISQAAAAFPFPANIPGIIAETARAAVNVAGIASQNFAMGGIVKGSSLTGDRVQVGVNSREMVLNQGQQARLFNMANGNGGGSSSGNTDALLGQLIEAVQSNRTTSIEIDGREIVSVVREQLDRGRRVS